MNRLECGDTAGRTSTDPGFKIQITKQAKKSPGEKSLQKGRGSAPLEPNLEEFLRITTPYFTDTF